MRKGSCGFLDFWCLFSVFLGFGGVFWGGVFFAVVCFVLVFLLKLEIPL